MTNENQKEKALEYFRYVLQEEQGFAQVGAEVTAGGAELQVTEPHPFLVVSGKDMLAGEMAGVEKLAGQQSIVFRGGSVLEAPIAVPEEGGPVRYIGAWTQDAARSLNEAILYFESKGRDTSGFAVVTVPEVGFAGVWLRDQHEVVAVANTLSRRMLDLDRIYSEGDLIEALRDPLAQRFSTVEANFGGEPERPPRA